MALYLVTGGGGFIGSALVRRLLERGDAVRVVDNFATGERRNLEAVRDRIDLRETDIADLDALRPAFAGVDYVLHQAALRSVPRSIDNPLASNHTNIDGTLNVLVAARDAGVRRVVYAGSSTAYGDSPTLPKVETMPVAPISPYGVSKLAAEMYCGVFHRVYGLETVTLRYFSVFGPRADPGSPYSGVLALFIKALLEGRQPTIFGDGEQSRDFTYVDNVVDANLLARTAPDAPGRVINVATSVRQTLNHSYRLLAGIIGTSMSGASIAAIKPVYEPARPGHILHSLADITQAREVLGFEPRVSFEQGLRLTVDWYRENFDSLPAAGI